jgi:hypothetical protein
LKEMYFKTDISGRVQTDSIALTAVWSGMDQRLVRNQLCVWLEGVWEWDVEEGIWA